MKKILYTAAILTLMLNTGCSDYLEEENPSSATAENYYVTPGGYETLVNSAYSTLRDVYGPTPYIFSAGTDLFFGAHQDAPLALTTYQSLTPGTPQVGDFFQTLYESIQVQNTALHYADLTEEFPELESRKGETRFLRAYYYFLLVQSFGDVTLVTDMINEPITHFERTPASEVYEFIIDELEMALEEVPVTQNEYGRVEKRAVMHMLAKAYLTRAYEDFGQPSDFSQAASYADQAINGQSLDIPFSELFGRDNEMNEEVLFAVQYDEASLINGGAHNWDNPWGPLIQGAFEGVSKKNMLHPTEYLFTAFGEHDTRFEGTFLNVRTSPYVGNYLDPENTPVEIYYPRTEEQIANVEEWRAANPETRSETTVIPIDGSWWASTSQQYPALQKFDRIQNGDVRFTHDLYIARLGESYLIAAEAYFQEGNITQAAERINEVRRRAAMEGHVEEILITEAEVDLDLILDERARELAGEGHRWFTLKRTGRLIERTILYNPQITSESQFMGNNGALKILRPIPLSAISLDEGEYPQNPAYAN
ncbi:RagB/SusD family nutrient uptake outer membrane protein [Autumnicola musiva]|uniref:RagB/SusD family nutrient uptake outer membrane protein n=1 Tax=Autumnicola musiva TaxID=3075589 RepID=A0ABU3D9B1_9FLAO|nr:RagB/SusD family nutrient uptake outer membrane protein [Zunongwangia sp. F117]MDT0677583.1 RagB/SusD family nutrient uptake outer membrane protein [Zunongwangia sp. F117]